MSCLRRAWQRIADHAVWIAVYLRLASWPDDDPLGHNPSTDNNTNPPERDEHPVVTRIPSRFGSAFLIVVLSACSNSQPPPPRAPLTLPAERPPLVCADFEPAPVDRPTEVDFIWRKCTAPDGSARWIGAFYECVDGRIWPVLTKVSRPPIPEPEPTGPEFDRCVGRG